MAAGDLKQTGYTTYISLGDKLFTNGSTQEVFVPLVSSLGIDELLPAQTGNNGKVLQTNGTTVSWQLVTSPVSSVNGQTGIVILTKSDIGLSNVDNTSDINKPISSATQTALNSKQDNLGYTPLNPSNNLSDVANTNTALNTLLPNQIGNNGKILKTDGTNTSWENDIGNVPAWGDIAGTLSDQTDLQTALDTKITNDQSIINALIFG